MAGSHGNTETVTVLATSWHLARILFVFCDIIWGGVGGGAVLPVSRGSAQHPTPSSAVLMKTRRGAPASRAYWRHGHTSRWRHMCGSRYQMMESVSVSPSTLVIKVMKCISIWPHSTHAELCRAASLCATPRTYRAAPHHQPIALLCVIRKRKLSFAAHFPHLPAAAARLVT